MANVLGFDQKQNMPQMTLIDTLGSMAMSNFVSAKVQGQHGTNDAYQRVTNNTKQKTMDTISKQNPQQNQPVNTPNMSTNLGNCTGPAVKIFFVLDTI